MLAASAGQPGTRPPQPVAASSVAKDFLGAAMTLTIIGAIILQATDRLASQSGGPARAGGGASTACRPSPITSPGP